jgi:hypothetical protein
MPSSPWVAAASVSRTASATPPLLPSAHRAMELEAMARRQNHRSELPDADLHSTAAEKEPSFGAPMRSSLRAPSLLLSAHRAEELEAMARRQNHRSELPDADLSPTAAEKEPSFVALMRASGTATEVSRHRKEGGRRRGKRQRVRVPLCSWSC